MPRLFQKQIHCNGLGTSVLPVTLMELISTIGKYHCLNLVYHAFGATIVTLKDFVVTVAFLGKHSASHIKITDVYGLGAKIR